MMTRMKELEDKNRRFKKMYAEERLKAEIISEAIPKKVVKPSHRREMAQAAVRAHGISVSSACATFAISQTCLSSSILAACAEKRGIQISFIQPGQLQKNAYIERYNRTVRYDLLAHYLFESVDEVQEFTMTWALDLQLRTPEQGARR